MDQRSIVLYLSVKGLSVKAIHQELVQTFGFEAVAYHTAARYLRAAKFLAQRKEARDGTGVTRTDSVNIAILKALIDNPLFSVPELSRLTGLSRSTVHRHMTESLGFTVRHLHWISHRLSGDQKTISVSLPRQLL
jgi:AraC-like DNA-binding protein